jgi:hypothetical protein
VVSGLSFVFETRPEGRGNKAKTDIFVVELQKENIQNWGMERSRRWWGKCENVYNSVCLCLYYHAFYFSDLMTNIT